MSIPVGIVLSWLYQLRALFRSMLGKMRSLSLSSHSQCAVYHAQSIIIKRSFIIFFIGDGDRLELFDVSVCIVISSTLILGVGVFSKGVTIFLLVSHRSIWWTYSSASSWWIWGKGWYLLLAIPVEMGSLLLLLL